MLLKGLDLEIELNVVVEAMNRQIEEISFAAREQGVAPHLLRDTTGGFLLSPILIAKATALKAIVDLQAQMVEEKIRAAQNHAQACDPADGV